MSCSCYVRFVFTSWKFRQHRGCSDRFVNLVKCCLLDWSLQIEKQHHFLNVFLFSNQQVQFLPHVYHKETK